MNSSSMWIAISAAVTMTVTALATAWAQSRIGSAGAASLAERPELRTTVIILVAIPETMVMLGFALAMVMLQRLGG